MNLQLMSTLLLALAICQFGCNGSARLQDRPNISSETIINAQVSVTPITTPAEMTIRREDFLGCWSSGTGKVIRITENQIFLSTNNFKPVKYVEEKWEDNLLVLRLIDRPQFYYLQEIISLEFHKPEKDGISLTIRDYFRDDELDKERNRGISGWVTSDCEELFGDDKGAPQVSDKKSDGK